MMTLDNIFLWYLEHITFIKKIIKRVHFFSYLIFRRKKMTIIVWNKRTNI